MFILRPSVIYSPYREFEASHDDILCVGGRFKRSTMSRSRGSVLDLFSGCTSPCCRGTVSQSLSSIQGVKFCFHCCYVRCLLGNFCYVPEMWTTMLLFSGRAVYPSLCYPMVVCILQYVVNCYDWVS
jgi:hypothetical protein